MVDELPYQCNKKVLLERIAELVHEKKIDGISHIQDESDKSGMRVVIELKRGELPEVVLNNLYKQTQLQDTFGINMVALVDASRAARPEGDARQLPRASPRRWSPAHELRPAQGARARPRAGGPRGSARTSTRSSRRSRRRRRRPRAACGCSRRPGARSSSPTCSRARRRRRNAVRRRRVGLRPRSQRVSPVGNAGPAHSRNAAAAPHRAGTGQDRRGVRELLVRIADLLDILARPARITAIIADELTAIKAAYGDARKSEIVLHARGHRGRGPDCAAGRGRDLLACRLHQGPAGRRLPGAAARRARQAGGVDARGRLYRARVHRPHPRFHPVLPVAGRSTG